MPDHSDGTHRGSARVDHRDQGRARLGGRQPCPSASQQQRSQDCSRAALLQELVVVLLPEGGRQFATVDPTPKPAATKRRTVKSKSSKTRSTRTPKTGPKRGVVQRVVRAGESLERGISVFHPAHGQGFVVLSTRSMARIRFMPSQEERSVRVADLEVLEGN